MFNMMEVCARKNYQLKRCFISLFWFVDNGRPLLFEKAVLWLKFVQKVTSTYFWGFGLVDGPFMRSLNFCGEVKKFKTC